MSQWRVEVGNGIHGGYEPEDGGTAYELAERFSRNSKEPVSIFHRLPWEKRWARRHRVAVFRAGEEIDL